MYSHSLFSHGGERAITAAAGCGDGESAGVENRQA